jgi:bifunctional DNA-binding transcriptional regulator/antitoxin component of YhaV-PrlF toxin-antitoxin module
MEITKFVGKVLQNGYLAIPIETLHNLGIGDGDELEVTVKKLKLEKSFSDEKLLKEISFPESKQKRLSKLLAKNQEREISASELVELEKLVFEAQLKTIEKARDLLKLKKARITRSVPNQGNDN